MPHKHERDVGGSYQYCSKKKYIHHKNAACLTSPPDPCSSDVISVFSKLQQKFLDVPTYVSDK